MAFASDQVEELKRLFPNVQRSEEGGCIYFLLPQLRLPERCTPASTDALFCPTARDGYPSRLFFAEQVQCSTKLNWNANGVRIVERNWHAFSWKVNPNLRLAQMVAAHLKAFR